MPPRDWRSRSDESNSHYPADAPHQQRQLTALERQAYALESLDLSRSLAEEFHDIDGLDDRIVHRVNTIAGSMRVTCTMAAIADTTHMRTVSRNSPKVSAGVMTIGNAVSAVAATTIKPMPAARQNPTTALISAWQMMTL